MRGEVCVGSASILSFVAIMLLIFAHVGQINTSSVPRGISMANLNMSNYGAGLAQAFAPDPVEGLYTTNASEPLGKGLGARNLYKFGLYSRCGYVNETAGICSNQTIGTRFEPYDYILSDMAENYTQYADAIFANTTFQNDGAVGSSTKAAYWMILLGTICAVLALISGLIKHTVFFLTSTIFSILASLFVLTGAAIWTVAIKDMETINNLIVATTKAPLGITVSVGHGLYLVWAAFACLLVSTVPYMIRHVPTIVSRFIADEFPP